MDMKKMSIFTDISLEIQSHLIGPINLKALNPRKYFFSFIQFKKT